MLHTDFVAGSGLNVGILPVKIVYLKLYELSFRMICEDLVQDLRRIVEGDTGMFYKTFCLGIPDEVPYAVLLVPVHALVIQRVQKIKVEVSGSGPFQADLKLCQGLLLGLDSPIGGVQLAGQIVGVSGVPVAKSLLGGLL